MKWNTFFNDDNELIMELIEPDGTINHKKTIAVLDNGDVFLGEADDYDDPYNDIYEAVKDAHKKWK